jgi:hypothetical protein
MELTLENSLTTNLENEQSSFLQSTFGQILDKGLNIGIRALLPDFVENDVIDIKDSLLNNGLKSAIDTTVDKVMNIGKSIQGIFTGKFENIEQVNKAVESSGILDTVSGLLDKTIKKVTSEGVISKTVGSLISAGKDAILGNISSEIQNTYEKQLNGLVYLDKYINNWKNYYNNQDFEGMQKEYYKLKDRLEELMPLESTLNKARTVENLHKLIQKNGKNFDLSDEELKLAQML